MRPCRPPMSNSLSLPLSVPGTWSVSSRLPATSSRLTSKLAATRCDALGIGRSIWTRSWIAIVYFAGSVERRVRELEEMFVRDDVRAVFCARGGYGANYLLDQLDLEKIEAHPKIFVGYSDITSSLTYFTDARASSPSMDPWWRKTGPTKVESISPPGKSALSQSSPWDVPLESRGRRTC